jgi:hypothetical protein
MKIHASVLRRINASMPFTDSHALVIEQLVLDAAVPAMY